MGRTPMGKGLVVRKLGPTEIGTEMDSRRNSGKTSEESMMTMLLLLKESTGGFKGREKNEKEEEGRDYLCISSR